MNIVNVFDKDGFGESKYKKPAKYKNAYKEIATKFGAKKLGFYVNIMEPKTFSCPYHWHSAEEELVMVLEGAATVRNNSEFRVVKAGDLIYYGTGPESVHHMYNHTDKPFKYFVLSNIDQSDACHYPDSRKQSTPNAFIQDGKEVDYFKDEEDPSVYWPKDRL